MEVKTVHVSVQVDVRTWERRGRGSRINPLTTLLFWRHAECPK